MKSTAYMIGILQGFHSHLLFQSNSEKKYRKENKGLRHACIKRNNQDMYIENKYNRKM